MTLKRLLFLTTATIWTMCTACNNSDSEKSRNAKTDSTKTNQKITSADTTTKKKSSSPSLQQKGNIPNNYNEKSWNISTGTFSKTSYVYFTPDTNSKQIDILDFHSPLTILLDTSDFFKIYTEHSKIGFIKKSDVYIYSFYDFHDGAYFEFLVGLSKYRDLWNSHLKIVKTDCNPNSKKKILLDSYLDTSSSSQIGISQVFNTALKNVNLLLKISTERSWSCPGVHNEKFIIHCNNKISDLIESSSTGESGYYDYTKIYLPVKLVNGKILLAENGVLSVDEATGLMRTYKYSQNIGIPIDELVVAYQEEAETFESEDPKADRVYNPDGTLKVKINSKSTILYRWNGTKLIKVKTIK